MTKKRTKHDNYYCKTCGARFGDDGRAFEAGTLKDGAKSGLIRELTKRDLRKADLQG